MRASVIGLIGVSMLLWSAQGRGQEALAGPSKAIDTGAPAPPIDADQRAVLVAGPGKVDVDALLRMMPASARYRFVVRLESLVGTIGAKRLLALLPAGERAQFDGFVRDSGVDPLLAVRGIVGWSTAENESSLGKQGRDTTLVVLSRGGAFVDLLRWLEHNAFDSDDGEDWESFTLILLDPDIGDRAKQVIAWFRRDSGLDQTTELKLSETASIFSGRLEGGVPFYGYLWSGGFVMASDSALRAPLAHDAAAHAYRLVRRLKVGAAAATPVDERMLVAAGPEDGQPFELGASISGEDIRLTLVAPAGMLGATPSEVSNVETGIKLMKGMADAQLDQLYREQGVPEGQRGALVALVRRLEIDFSEQRVRATASLPLKLVLSSLAAP